MSDPQYIHKELPDDATQEAANRLVEATRAQMDVVYRTIDGRSPEQWGDPAAVAAMLASSVVAPLMVALGKEHAGRVLYGFGVGLGSVAQQTALPRNAAAAVTAGLLKGLQAAPAPTPTAN